MSTRTIWQASTARPSDARRQTRRKRCSLSRPQFCRGCRGCWWPWCPSCCTCRWPAASPSKRCTTRSSSPPRDTPTDSSSCIWRSSAIGTSAYPAQPMENVRYFTQHYFFLKLIITVNKFNYCYDNFLLCLLLLLTADFSQLYFLRLIEQ